jgi:transposase
LKRLVFENNIEGFMKLLTYSESVRVKGCFEKVVFGVEPTANYYKPLAESPFTTFGRVFMHKNRSD